MLNVLNAGHRCHCVLHHVVDVGADFNDGAVDCQNLSMGWTQADSKSTATGFVVSIVKWRIRRITHEMNVEFRINGVTKH